MNPAQFIRWHDSAVTDAAPPSMDLVRGEGIVYAKKCGAPKPLPPETKAERLKRAGKPRKPARCASTIRHHSSAQGRYVCGRCGAAWPAFRRQVLRGAVQETALRGDGPERKLARVADVGVAIRRFLEETPTWPARLYLANVRGISLRRLAEEGPAMWPDSGAFVWSVKRVRTAVAEGSAAWRAQLRKRGLLAD